MQRITFVILFFWLSRAQETTEIKLITRHNYPVETHNVTTSAGYILTHFRIPSSTQCTKGGPKPVVFIQHGILLASDGFLVTGPKTGLPFMLADACFDVWLGNCRGTRYSRRHTTLKACQRKFWYFSFHEMGLQDLPDQIDYVLSTTKQKALHFVCYSQGCSTLMVLLSMRPEYNEKLKTANLLAPAVFMEHSMSWGVKLVRPLFMRLPEGELLPPRSLLNSAMKLMCKLKATKKLCASVYLLLSGHESVHTNASVIPNLVVTHPSGVSTRQPKHYIQLKKSGKFRPYDFGPVRNWKTYGQFSPPDYPLEMVNPMSPVHVFFSDWDNTVSSKDIPKLVSKLPRSVEHRIMESTWDHLDFLIGKTVDKVINQPVISIINEFENSQKN
ncbi:lipase 1 isoform X2 [Drosophila biarmipes]|uniref:lipase 1 isoform X2 n=1 Tax=Drosophila biarmipes TaxID=125945 RepID=UPI001CDAFA83|nr:lipase 1 isoform X2 [Drosophila biarmipes]